MPVEYGLEYILGKCKKEFDYLGAEKINKEAVQYGRNKFMPKEVNYILSQIHLEYAERIRRNAGEEQQNDEGFSVDRRSMPSITNGQRRLDFEKSLQANINKVLKPMTEYEKRQFIDSNNTLGYDLEDYDDYYHEKDEDGEYLIADRIRKKEGKNTDTIIVSQDNKCHRIAISDDTITYEEHGKTDSRDLVIRTSLQGDEDNTHIILKKYIKDGAVVKYYYDGKMKEDDDIEEKPTKIVLKNNRTKLVHEKNEDGDIEQNGYCFFDEEWHHFERQLFRSYRDADIFIYGVFNGIVKSTGYKKDIELSDEDIEFIKKGKKAISERIPKIYRRIHPENAVIINRLDKETNKMELDGTR